MCTLMTAVSPPRETDHAPVRQRLAGLAAAADRAALRAALADWRRAGLRIGLVPTMGALHEGHLSLIDHARAHADRVVASVFVNPAQFAPGEDFDAYPRQLETDAAALKARGCDLLYAPSKDVMYPEGFATQVRVSGVSQDLESAARPHFFHGVATVVTKLLLQARPDVAVFGEKDYQQLLVIKRLAADLDLETTILSGATVREPDGLALSSRNAYLSAAARAHAPALARALFAAAEALAAGACRKTAEAEVAATLRGAGFEAVDYVAVRDAETLSGLPDGPVRRPARLLAAARLDGVRLLDNVPVTPAP